MKIIPAIDIQDGKCVRLMQGNFDKSTTYGSDPYEVAIRWKEMGARIIQVVDLDAARYGKLVNQEVVKKIATIPDIQIQYGGGIQTEADIKLLFAWGVERVIIGTLVFEKEEEVKKWISTYGRRILISLDAKEGMVMKRGWKNNVGKRIGDSMKLIGTWGALECIYTDIVRDGTLQSINVNEVERLIAKAGLKVIIAGGVRTLADIVALKKIGASGVIIGRALYEKTLNLKEVILLC